MRGASGAIGAMTVALCTCAVQTPPRPQVVLYVNTDLPVPGFADTLRIDWLDSHGDVIETRYRVAPNAADWPISFGVAVSRDGSPVLFRLRVYPAGRFVDTP